MNKRTKKIARNLVVIAIILFGLGWVCAKFIHFGRIEYTDNAQIRRNIIPINSRVQGFIQEVRFDDFQFVHKGDTLVVIENSEYRLKVVQAKANYEATRAKYDMLVRQKRSTSLVKDEQTQRLEQNQTNIEVAMAAQNLAELNLSYTVITAPCDGVTSRRAIQEGQLIQPGQTLLSLVEYDNVWIIANYKETQTYHIREGLPVRIKVDAMPGITYHGQVATLSNATDAQYSIIPQDNSAGNFVKVEQRVPVKIVFTPENSREDINRLRSGMNVECEVNY